MADRKSGPVKPPVIDLTARDAKRPAGARGKPSASESGSAAADPATPQAATAAPEGVSDTAQAPEPDAAEATKSEPHAPMPPRPQARLAMPWSAISMAAVAGALLGTGLTYLVATWILLPSGGPALTDPGPELAGQAQQISALEARLATLEGDTRASLEATTARLDDRLADLGASLEAVRSEIPDAANVDLGGVEARIATLGDRIEAVAAGASSADAEALTETLARIEQDVATLSGRIDQIDTQLLDNDAAVTSLAADVAAGLAANPTAGGDIAAAVQLPLVVSGLETAFSTGRPYRAELDSLKSILPELDIPASVDAAAEQGLARPGELADRFAAALPDLLAGGATSGTGDWSRDALDWARGLLAIRPAQEIPGDSPEAVISRLEAAMERRDFTAANVLVGELPASMREAAGPLVDEIAAHAAAEAFIAAMRARALAPAGAEAG